jgi:peptide/nickel transport system substrate-binding protein
MNELRTSVPGRTPLTRRGLLLGMTGLGAGMALSGCRLAVDEARGDVVDGGPRAGGTLTVAVNHDPSPAAAQSQLTTSMTWRRLVFETLSSYDAGGVPQPSLAAGWQLDEGGRLVTVNLRRDVLLHSGRPMDAHDVMYSLTRPAEPAARSQVRSIAELISDMTADDPWTVRLRLERPASNLFDLFELAAIIDHESGDGLEDGSAVVGTGPFVWESWTPGSSLSLARNARYRVPQRPYLDRVEQSTIGDGTALITAVRGGRAHVAYGAAPLDAKGLSADGRFEVVRSAAAAYSVGITVTEPPFDDVRVRRAVGYAIDRERVNSSVFAGYGDPSSLWWTSKDSGWSEAQSRAYTYDPDRARALIAEAGATGREVVLDVRSILAVRSMAEIVRYDLENAGLRVRIQALDDVTFNQRLAAGKLSALWATGFGLADIGAVTFASSVPAFLPDGNASRFESDEYRRLVDAALSAAPQERAASVQAVGAHIQEEAFNQCVVVSPLMAVQSRRLRDAGQTALGALHLDDAYLV